MSSCNLRRAVGLTLALAACGTPARPAPTTPWQRVQPTGAPVALVSYGAHIDAYAPDDRGAYVVQLDGDPTARAALAATLGATDDVVGADGYVLRLDATAARDLAGRAGVRAIAPLQPSDRQGVLIDRGTELPEVRIDLLPDASADELAAVAAWVTWRGGQVLWRGRAALRARLPHAAREEAARLSVVRWIE